MKYDPFMSHKYIIPSASHETGDLKILERDYLITCLT